MVTSLRSSVLSHQPAVVRPSSFVLRTSYLFMCWVLAPQAVLACPVCFGDPSSPMTSGMNLAILTLLGITACVLGAFGGFFVYLIRRAKMAARANDPPGASYQTQRGMLTVKVFLVGTEGRH